MTKEELKEHCKKQIKMCEFWAEAKGEKPCGKIYEEHKLILELLEQELCEDAISRQAAIDAVRENTFRLTFAEEQRYEGHVVWDAKAVYSDVIEGALLELPPVTPQPKIGRWYSNAAIQEEIDGQIVKAFVCSECSGISVFRMAGGEIVNGDLCPNCGAKMEQRWRR